MLLRREGQASTGDGLSFITSPLGLEAQTREHNQTGSQWRHDTDLDEEPNDIPLQKILVPGPSTKIAGTRETTRAGRTIVDPSGDRRVSSAGIRASGPFSSFSSSSEEGEEEGGSVNTLTTTPSTVLSNISSTPNGHNYSHDIIGIRQEDEQSQRNRSYHSPNPSTSTQRTVQWDLPPPASAKKERQTAQLSGREVRREEKERERQVYENRSEVLDRAYQIFADENPMAAKILKGGFESLWRWDDSRANVYRQRAVEILGKEAIEKKEETKRRKKEDRTRNLQAGWDNGNANCGFYGLGRGSLSDLGFGGFGQDHVDYGVKTSVVQLTMLVHFEFGHPTDTLS
ncbi:hypothetical protein BP6252_05739 [Coleophoma cylindrospora]|uniref:Uncharacterized protein n=1 Tax=Coleophoma cylindrospora TaxID=1849047 RepID=A0A3D8RUN8_9HELO|nr:hypothetical protein BP6252_05739 [Coleophoma cylindrospora]